MRPFMSWAMLSLESYRPWPQPQTQGVLILFSKIDLKNGYWRMIVNSHEAWNFAYVLPPVNPDDPPELVVPYALQMGWSESPDFFCAVTETARDIAESSYKSGRPMPPHPD